MKYSIADYLSDAQKRRALAATYDERGYTTDGKYNCALGVALGVQMPGPFSIMAELGHVVEQGDSWSEHPVYVAARYFTDRWDRHLLKPDRLAEALGMVDDA